MTEVDVSYQKLLGSVSSGPRLKRFPLKFQPLFSEALSRGTTQEVSDAVFCHPEHGRDVLSRLPVRVHFEDHRLFFGQFQRFKACHASLYIRSKVHKCKRRTEVAPVGGATKEGQGG